MSKPWQKIKLIVHPSTLLYFLLCLLAGWFKECLIAFFIVLVHEYAHTLCAWLFDYDIQDIHLYPFGAFVDLADYGLHANWQDFLVAISGPASYFLLVLLGKCGRSFLGEHSYIYYCQMNRSVCLFNLLPIWPLDGAKILLLGLSYIMDYLLALKMMLILSFMGIVLFMQWTWQPNYLFVYGYLFMQIALLGRQFYWHYLRLLSVRSSNPSHGPKRLHFDHSFFKPYANFYFHEGRIIDEKEFIHSKIFVDKQGR